MQRLTKSIVRVMSAFVAGCLTLMLMTAVSAEDMAPASSAAVFAQFTPPGFEANEAADDQPEPRRIYHWQGNLTAFLSEVFRSDGLDDQEAYDQALRVERLMNPKFDWKHATPERIIGFAFTTIGYTFTKRENAINAAVMALEVMHGDLESLPDPDAALEGEPKPKTPINSVGYFLWRNNLTNFMTSAMLQLDHDLRSALDLAQLVLGLMDLESRDTLRYRETNWETVDPHALLVEAFTTIGIQPIEATTLSTMCLTQLGVPGWQMPRPRPEANTLKTELCPVYYIKVIWCNSEGDQVIEMIWMKRNKWDAIAACPVSSVCGPGDAPWYELTTTGNCIPNTPLSPTCVWLNPISGPIEVDCTNLPFVTHDCFEETNGGVDCFKIESTCGNAIIGPSGCPDCL